jgi:hypothetical protein
MLHFAVYCASSQIETYSNFLIPYLFERGANANVQDVFVV